MLKATTHVLAAFELCDYSSLNRLLVGAMPSRWLRKFKSEARQARCFSAATFFLMGPRRAGDIGAAMHLGVAKKEPHIERNQILRRTQ
jgi:hypothetical protein